MKINPVSSKTQSKSLGFWRVTTRLCATTSSLIQRTVPFFLRQGTTKLMNYSFCTKKFSKIFSDSFKPSRGFPTGSFLSFLTFQRTCFSSKAGTKIWTFFNKTNFLNLFFIFNCSPSIYSCQANQRTHFIYNILYRLPDRIIRRETGDRRQKTGDGRPIAHCLPPQALSTEALAKADPMHLYSS